MKVMQLQKQRLPLVVLFCPLLWLFGSKPGGFPSQLTVLMFQVFLQSNTETERAVSDAHLFLINSISHLFRIGT